MVVRIAGTISGIAAGVIAASAALAQEGAGKGGGGPAAPGAAAAEAAPFNDDIASAFLVRLGADRHVAVNGNTTEATREPGEPPHRSPEDSTTVWYTFIAPSTGTMTVDTHGSRIDTVVAVYRGRRYANMRRPLALNDDHDAQDPFYHLTSRVTFPVVQGRLYSVVVAGFMGAEGSYRLWLTPPGIPYN